MNFKIFVFGATLILTLTQCSNHNMTQLSTTYFHKFKQNKSMYEGTEDTAEFSTWLKKAEKNYYSYRPAKDKLQGLNTEGLYIHIIGAAWCSDTREQVSNFLRILEAISFPMDQIEYHFVDRDKKAPGDDFVSQYHFTKVPTFILFRNEVEIGSIIEGPVLSLEDDLIRILNKP